MPNFEECDKCGERCKDGAERLRVCADCDRDMKRLGWFDSASTQVARREAYDKGRAEGYAEAVADVVAHIKGWPFEMSRVRLVASIELHGAHVGAEKKGREP